MSNLDLDTRLLSEFVYALSIARRQVVAYPPGHPMIASASEKLIALKERLLEFRQEVTIGIARNTLLIEGNQLDPANPVYRDLALNLFKAGVASLTVERSATAEDVRLLFTILASPGDRVAAGGGLAALLHSSGVRGFRAQEIDYRAFHATEVDVVSAPKVSGINEESAVLWKAFASGMVSGSIDPNGVRQLPQEQFDPVLLAEALNQGQHTGKSHAGESYEHAIAEFIKGAGNPQVNSQARQETFDRFGLLIEQLSPELRRRFLNSTLQGLSTAPDQAMDMLANWSHATIIEALEQAETNQLQVPRVMLDILGKLGTQTAPRSGHRQEAPGTERNRQQTADMLTRLFCDGGVESYVPKDYSDALDVLAAADITTNLEPAQIEELLDNLNGHALERQFCAITLELMEQDVENRSVEAITRNLEEMIPYFLDAGDFQSLTAIYVHLLQLLQLLPLRAQPQPAFATAVHKTLDIFAGEAFTTQVLDGLDDWGKDQYPAVRKMIGCIGIPFIAPLLDRLAEEPLMTRRRLYMDCLQRIGTQATGFIVGRLLDPRWYVVRNMVVLMREINDPEVLLPLGRLFTHPHPKVRYEVMRTCLHFNDPRAERYLLHGLEQTDTEFLTGIVRLAVHSRTPEVINKLIVLLNTRGSSEPELALKGAIIATLAEMGSAGALPGLGTFIEGKSLFISSALLKLKLEAVASLARYPRVAAMELATRLSQKASGEIARAAEKTCLKIRGSAP